MRYLLRSDAMKFFRYAMNGWMAFIVALGVHQSAPGAFPALNQFGWALDAAMAAAFAVAAYFSFAWAGVSAFSRASVQYR